MLKKRFLTVMVIMAVLLSQVFIFSPVCTAGTGTTYYVKTGGNDNADGKSPANAWASISKVNAMASSFVNSPTAFL
jgi:hypothetical protein